MEAFFGGGFGLVSRKIELQERDGIGFNEVDLVVMVPFNYYEFEF